MSTYSPSLKITLIADGDQAGTWGQTTNTNLGTLLEQAITGVVSITMLDANYTLTNLNGVSDEARNAVLVVDGTNTGVRDVIAPLAEKLYIVKNSTTGGYSIRIKTSTGVAVTIPNGVTAGVYCDGTDFYAQSVNTIGNQTVNGNQTITGNQTVTGNLAVTGTTTLSTALAAAYGGTGLTSPGTSGNVLTSNGAAWTSTALPATFVSGMILLWSGSIATIPSGWLICDGTNGTPDLRDRFVVGAGSTYAVAATGGSANAVVVSHTHTASVTDPGHAHTYTRPNAQSVQSGSATPCYINSTTATTSTATTGISVSNSTEGVSGTNANLPPYYALAYIMKL